MFGLDIWLIWLIIGVIFIISEIFTAGFIMMPLGLAALASCLVASIFPNSGIAIQLATFIVAGTILLFFGQKLADKISKDPDVKVGADRFIDQTGIVIRDIDLIKNSGMVRISDDEWRAVSADEKTIKKGEKIIVNDVSGTRLIVSKYKGE